MSNDKDNNRLSSGYIDTYRGSYRIMVIGITIMIIASVVTAITFGIITKTYTSIEQNTTEPYEEHFAFIVDDRDSEFWDEVYEAAKNKATEEGILLEDIEKSLLVGYSNEDLLRVAINSSVDGIVYAGSASEESIALINEAEEKGIGVAVLQNDIESSSRQCFVGANNYEIGQMFAAQIFDILKTDTKNHTVTILASGDMTEGATNLITLAIEDYLLEHVEDTELPDIEILRINAEDTFSVEEEIRNIILNERTLPEIMICLEGIYTQCVTQAIVDYNRVGELQVVGYFANDDIVNAIDKEILHSTVSIDTKEMGQSCITALEEYIKMGYTNSYVPVKMEIIDRREAHKLVNEEETEDDEI